MWLCQVSAVPTRIDIWSGPNTGFARLTFTVDASFIPGDPEQVVTRAIAEREADLLIMGAYSHSPWRSLLLGSRTNDLLRASQVPTITLHL
jgi:nucleotide-binding universal stress UspA family protein